MDLGADAIHPHIQRSYKCGHVWMHCPSNPLSVLKPMLVSGKLQFTDLQHSLVTPRLTALALKPGWLSGVA